MLDRMSLTIKGTIAEATAAAAARGITLENPQSLERWNNVVAQATADPVAVGAWFAESGNVPPFPAGTLLLFGYVSK